MKDDFGGIKLKVCWVYYFQKIRVGWFHREANETN